MLARKKRNDRNRRSSRSYRTGNLGNRIAHYLAFPIYGVLYACVVVCLFVAVWFELIKYLLKRKR